MSAFILSAALDKPIVIIDGLDESITQLKAIGRNLNQLTTLCNMGKIYAPDLAGFKQQFGAIIEAVFGLKEG